MAEAEFKGKKGPDERAREAIFRLKLQDRPIKDIDYLYLAKNTESYSEADIKKTVEIAIKNMISEIADTDLERDITTDDILNAAVMVKSMRA